MEDSIYLLIFLVAGGAMAWQGSAIHIEQYLTNNDDTYEPPGFLSRMFIGRLFSTLPVLGRYAEVRSENGLRPIGAYGFAGGLVVGLGGLVALFAALSSSL